MDKIVDIFILSKIGWVRSFDYPIISTPIFKLNTGFTTGLLTLFWMFLTAEELFLSPIACNLSGCKGCDEHLQKFMNTWCWISSTFTVVPEQAQEDPGVGPGILQPHPGLPQKHYNYYQFVIYALFFQTLACYHIARLWWYWENNLMIGLVQECERYAITKEDIKAQVHRFTDYFATHLDLHTSYVYKYWFCELLCFLNILIQMILIDWFFYGDFSKWGIRVLNLTEEFPEERSDNIMLVFPKLTKCSFHKFGPTGSIETRDALCVLGQNNYNEKVYIFIWFWYWFLLILSVATLAFRVALFSSKRIRINVLGSRDWSIPEGPISHITNRVSIGDWWVIYMLALNVDGRVFKDFIESLAGKMGIIVPVTDAEDEESRLETY